GFKTHAELEQAAQLITDEKGVLKPFNQFLNDAKTINAEYNHNFLRSEYNQAVQSAQIAAKWHDVQSRKDLVNLQYRTANDERVRAEHRRLHGVTLPVDDPFWKQFTPPLGWNCRCTIVEVLKDDYPESDSMGSIATATQITDKPKDKIFRFNPGIEKAVFPKKHPYLPKGCGECGKGVGSKNLAYDPNSVWCQACKAIAECERKLPIGTQKDSYKRVLEYSKKNIIGKVTYTDKVFNEKTAIFTRQSIVHSLGYGELYYTKVDVLNNINEYLTDIKNMKQVPIEHNEKGNIAAMYEAKVKYKGDDKFGKGRDMLLQLKEYDNGMLIFYFIKFI
nr:phage head morphogenesis protein [Bacteroidales bacterium]